MTNLHGYRKTVTPTVSGNLLVTDCSYFPLSVFIFKSVLHFGYINASFLYETIYNLNSVMDIPLRYTNNELYEIYQKNYDELILPWSFHHIVELYLLYDNNELNTSDISSKLKQLKMATELLSGPFTGITDKQIGIEELSILKNKSFYPNTGEIKGAPYYITDVDKYNVQVLPQLRKYRLLTDMFDILKEYMMKVEGASDTDNTNVNKKINNPLLEGEEAETGTEAEEVEAGTEAEGGAEKETKKDRQIRRYHELQEKNLSMAITEADNIFKILTEAKEKEEEKKKQEQT